jgi:hypothetical protein
LLSLEVDVPVLVEPDPEEESPLLLSDFSDFVSDLLSDLASDFAPSELPELGVELELDFLLSLT